jgi:hypothetical protein
LTVERLHIACDFLKLRSFQYQVLLKQLNHLSELRKHQHFFAFGEELCQKFIK